MAVHIVRLGSPRTPNEGLRIGTVRRPPRGVAKADYARRDFYDTWLPNLAPSEALLQEMRADRSDAGWRRFARRYRAEMKQPEPRRVLQMLAALSQQTDFAVGCYCQDEGRCHRSILRELLVDCGAVMAESDD
jgi:uncharacterized protein YeaO (DUF488 family)